MKSELSAFRYFFIYMIFYLFCELFDFNYFRFLPYSWLLSYTFFLIEQKLMKK